MKKLFGGLLLAAGILIGGASGLCSLVFIVMGLSEGAGGFGLGILPMVLMIGGIPFAIGVGLFFGGRALLRSAREEEAEAERLRRFE
jgi:hypothetical protein